MTTTEKLTVFYDGACPLCQREIGFYRRQRGAADITWVDVSRDEAENVAEGLTRQQAMARFHVRDQDGRLMSGAAAFATLWRVLPRFRLVGRLAGVAPITWILDRAYDVFLRWRPRLQARARRRLS